jgi:hypothetical protein
MSSLCFAVKSQDYVTLQHQGIENARTTLSMRPNPPSMVAVNRSVPVYLACWYSSGHSIPLNDESSIRQRRFAASELPNKN